ncbi:hypothetical protein QR680_015781 [Steinernema hermaphroditum]|uniref:Uncharacterized protein n=1 Tax=Steinernema hermaphroditum TaxID=289476 RepID=A0AA39LLH1_9BILA|nr:hypothetical protein QR680_015781 [Steinernema hermaphroditum]
MHVKKAAFFVALFCITLGFINVIPLAHLHFDVPNDFLLAGLDLLVLFCSVLLMLGIYSDTPHLFIPFVLINAFCLILLFVFLVISLIAQFAITVVIPNDYGMDEEEYTEFVEQLRASWTIIMLIIIAVMPIPIWFIWIALQCYRHSRKLHSNMQEEV